MSIKEGLQYNWIPQVMQKTKEEIARVESYLMMSADPFRDENSPIKRGFCSTYLCTRSGEKLDTNQFTEQQVLKLISQDLSAYLTDKKNYAMQQKSIFSYDLVNALKKHWNPSCRAIHRLEEALINAESKNNGELAVHLKELISRIDKNKIIEKAEAVAIANAQGCGEHGLVSKEDICRVLDQMATHEEKNNQQGRQPEIQR